MNYYTYAYLREDGTPYYIGKGSGKRIHNPSGKCVNLPPLNRRIKLKEFVDEESAYKHEEYMIAILGRKDIGTGMLRNMCDGGKSGTRQLVSQETREKRRRAMLGKKWKLSVQKVENIREGACKHFYMITHKDGKVCYTKNLRKWSKDNNLDHGPMYKLLHNKFVNKKGNYKGWVNVQYVEKMLEIMV